MKKALLIAVVMGLAVLSNAQVYTQTYSAGDINGVGDVQTSTAQTSPCPGVITFTGLPAGIVVDSVNVVYDFFSTMAGFQSPFDQRSYIRCTTTGISESTLALANVQGIATVANYNRTISIANGPLTSTTLTFELHAGTTSLIPGSCTGSGHLVLNNSWTVTVYTSGSATCAAPSNLAASSTSASSVRMLMEKPKTQLAASVPRSDMGIATAGTRVKRQLPENRRIVRITMRIENARVRNTSDTAPLMKTASSEITCSLMSSRWELKRATAWCAPSEI